MEKKITKKEFKKLYFNNPDPEYSTEQTQEYWNKFYESEKSAVYYLVGEPKSKEKNKLVVVKDYSNKDKVIYRVSFWSENEIESLYEQS